MEGMIDRWRAEWAARRDERDDGGAGAEADDEAARCAEPTPAGVGASRSWGEVYRVQTARIAELEADRQRVVQGLADLYAASSLVASLGKMRVWEDALYEMLVGLNPDWFANHGVVCEPGRAFRATKIREAMEKVVGAAREIAMHIDVNRYDVTTIAVGNNTGNLLWSLKEALAELDALAKEDS